MKLQLSYREDGLEAGCDEAGRGCLAGPVFAAAVILPPTFSHPLINDSKTLSETQRNEYREFIEVEALAFMVCHVGQQKIDEINILNASILAMHKAIEKLPVRPDHLLIDGNRFKSYPYIPHKCVVKGDSKFMNIAAASILAKTYRDGYMLELHESFPQYQWHKNKGYPTTDHRRAVQAFGISPHHRKSFRLKESGKQTSLF